MGLNVKLENFGKIAAEVPSGEHDALRRALNYLLNDTITMFIMQHELKEIVDMTNDEKALSAFESSVEMANMHLAQLYKVVAATFDTSAEKLVEAVEAATNVVLHDDEEDNVGGSDEFDLGKMMSAIDDARRRVK